MSEHLEPSLPPWKIWHQLPLHPQPARLESLTSYITRVAQVNGLTTSAELAALAGAAHNWQALRSFPDGSATSALGLTTLTGCTQTDLGAMTFLPLARRFGYAYSTKTQTLRCFLQGSLASHLRYCPRCLVEHAHPYYRLHWRFLTLTGCLTHTCQLLDCCGHCEARLSHLPHHPQLTMCPACHKDLRTCQALILEGDELRQLTKRTSDLILLLSSSLQPQEEDPRVVIGKRYSFARQQKGLSLQEATSLMKQNPQMLSAIEYASPYKKASFLDYLQYADLLEYSLEEMLSVPISLAPRNEDALFARLDEAIQESRDQEQPTRRFPGIAKRIGVQRATLKQYPRINSRLVAWEKQRQYLSARQNPQRESELIELVVNAVKQQEAQGQPVTQRSIAQMIGVTVQSLRVYSQVEALLIQVASKHHSSKPQSYLVSVQKRLFSSTGAPREKETR